MKEGFENFLFKKQCFDINSKILVNIEPRSRLVMVCHAENEPHRHHVCQKRCAAVAYERQRYAGYRHKTYAHSDILKDMEQKHRADTGADKSAEKVVRLPRRLEAAEDKQKQEADYYDSADKAEFLREHTEDEVGALCGKIAHLVLRSMEISLAPELTRTHGDL